MSYVLEAREIQCRYGDQPVVDGLSLVVSEGSLVCLLGPSGCGKTTVLRAVAGFHPLTAGEIWLNGAVVSRRGWRLAPEQRRVGMVFQEHALFPHLSVRGNVGFGLRALDAATRQARVNELLATVGLSDVAGRYPHELSGGQQQRVALARALAPQPRVLLMDEPFSNLDVELRERLGIEVRDILKSLSITCVLVTHDQMDAFALGDQVGVMCDGRIVQWDTPYNLYHEPSSRFVANFVGEGVFLAGTLLAPDTVETDLGVVRGNRAYGWGEGTPIDILVRPDDIVLDPEHGIRVEVVRKAFKGAEILYTLRLADSTTVLGLFPSHENYAVGEQVRVRLRTTHLVAFRRDDTS